MAWYYIVGSICFGVGLVLAGFRRRKKGDGEKKGKARGKVGIVAAILLLIASACAYLSPAGGWASSFGNWLAVSFWLAAHLRPVDGVLPQRQGGGRRHRGRAGHDG